MDAENDELSKIAAEAEAMEAEQAQASGALSGEVLPPRPDPAQEWRDAAHMGCGLILAMRPELCQEWTPDKLDALGDALNKCAERYGWTVGGIFSHPLIGLGLAVFPLAASAVRVERERAEKKAKERAAQPVGDGVPPVESRPGVMGGAG